VRFYCDAVHFASSPNCFQLGNVSFVFVQKLYLIINYYYYMIIVDDYHDDVCLKQ